MSDPPRVVVVGGGFAGLAAARGLGRAPVRVTLVDKRNHHLFQPLLYQVATAALSPGDIAVPIRSILRRQRNATVLLGEAVGVDLPHKTLRLADDELPYDFLVLAPGAMHSYFGHDAWSAHAPGLKTLEDALDIRGRVLYAFEAAEREKDATRQSEWMTFVVVGAGPTGVELAGALSEIARKTLARDFRRIDPKAARVVLVEGGSRPLASFPESLSEAARRALERLGVEVRTGSSVTDVDAHGVSLGEARIPARTVLWAAGVAASPLGRSLGVPLDRAGRVLVEANLTVPGHPEVFVVGDLASLIFGGTPVPGVAPAAIQEGRHAARSIVRALRGEPMLPFPYRDKGMLATIGRAAAVADFGRLRFSGLFAWLAWLFVHILYLIGFRNRAIVVFEWAWAYLTYGRGARLITSGTGRRPPP